VSASRGAFSMFRPPCRMHTVGDRCTARRGLEGTVGQVCDTSNRVRDRVRRRSYLRLGTGLVGRSPPGCASIRRTDML
jgi:hypothetical protein